MRRLVVPIVRRGHAHSIDTMSEQSGQGVTAGKTGKGPDALAGLTLITFGPASRSARNRGEPDVHESEIAAVHAVGVGPLEEGTVGLVKDHTQADHAGPQRLLGQVGSVLHWESIKRKGGSVNDRS